MTLKFNTELLLAPGQHPNSIGLVLVQTQAEMGSVVSATGFPSPVIPETGPPGGERAACCWNFDHPTKHGFLIFALESVTPALVSHEVTHAASLFVSHRVMASAAVQAKSEEEQAEYYEEALARTQEDLFRQAFDFIFQPAKVHPDLIRARKTDNFVTRCAQHLLPLVQAVKNIDSKEYDNPAKR